MRNYLSGMFIGMLLILMSSMGSTLAAQNETAVVTLSIFSGRVDPTWTLSPNQTQAFRYMLETLPSGEPAAIPDTLGYRGFEIRLGAETVSVFNGHVQLTPDSQWVDDPTRALESWLLGTAGDALEPDLAAELWAMFAGLPPFHSGTVSAVDGFAIYLVTGGLSPAEAAQADVTSLPYQAEPILQMDDITLYHAATHAFELTAAGKRQLAALKVPVSGLPFVVCVDGEAIYAGAFWASYSSLSYFESVVLNVTFAHTEEPLRLDLGYPGPSPELYTGIDLRSDPRILAAFEKAGKLD